MSEEEILKRLDKIEHQLKFFADSYTHLHNSVVKGVYVKFNEALLVPNIDRLETQSEKLITYTKEFIKQCKEESVIQTMAFMAKKLYEIEISLKNIKEKGVNKKLVLNLEMDGYEMVKRKPYDLEDGTTISEVEDPIKRLLSTISKREALVVSHRYGLLGQSEKSLIKIANLLNVSRSRVSQVLEKALRTMRNPKNGGLVEAITHRELKEDISGMK